jgi:hypothetical protein
MSTSAQLCPGGYDAVMTALYRGRTDLYDKCEIEPLLNIKDKIIQMCRLHDNVLEKLDICFIMFLLSWVHGSESVCFCFISLVGIFIVVGESMHYQEGNVGIPSAGLNPPHLLCLSLRQMSWSFLYSFIWCERWLFVLLVLAKLLTITIITKVCFS